MACDLPGSRRAGSAILFGLAPDGVYLAAVSPRRRCALTAPFHLCLIATHVWSRHRPCISVALSRGFPRVGVTHRPCPSVSGLSSRSFLSPRSRPTHNGHCTASIRGGRSGGTASSTRNVVGTTSGPAAGTGDPLPRSLGKLAVHKRRANVTERNFLLP